MRNNFGFEQEGFAKINISRVLMIALVFILILGGFFYYGLFFTNRLGAGVAVTQGRDYIKYIVPMELRTGDYSEAASWMGKGLYVIVDSEIRWTVSQLYVRRYEKHLENGAYPEAIQVCQKAAKIFDHYATDQLINSDCLKLKTSVGK